ncbi:MULTISPECIES: DNA repair protein RadA [Glutamicibacter]|uniref:DNA repair protein RadA n=1 Tax=Glutamicibacter halophytocola TaxID=1933880 RepID=A0A5B8IQ64_9MICC|nr:MULTISPECIES: DNA repair protein RadA [Glutamicibacter]ALG27650.1 DNA repair protein RadA [Glutamicibacter halophytocola]MBF6673504.1 DNA repair protein RadA [Glutamicibacter sp. FBE19]NQD40252.1 DNA repair protein RadA [Glutamicibacter halophytocola]QDY67031.1 DNA repair protein RadA [Glutamicibacter halophytocola]UUX59185.1 DNA repair protein RadA [Glutamicibacter halophytocola]
MAKTSTRSKSSPTFKCSECGWTTIKWVGRCGECQAWGTVEEVGVVSARTVAAAKVAHPAKPIAQIDGSEAAFRPSGVSELDRVLGGGLVPAAAILLAGEPGVGKSTLLLDVAAKAAQTGLRVLYLTGEESAAQVKSRAERINAIADTLYLAAETDLALALGQIQEIDPQLLILDSVQTFSSAEIDGAAGGVSQVREVAASIINAAKTRAMSTIMVGHVTKEGSVAGPRLLEHLVDVVCQFDGEKHSRLRILRALKNRYGATDEVGCFDLNEDGIESLTDPSKLFVTRTRTPVPGTCITVTLEGRRPLVAEVQTLLSRSNAPAARRATSGLDAARAQMVVAVLQARAHMDLSAMDSYIATVGGVKIAEPASDLACALALASSMNEFPLPQDFVAFGEVGLAGEVRQVPEISRRITEAQRLGFSFAMAPATPEPLKNIPDGIRVFQVENIAQALDIAFAQRQKPAR